MHTLLLNCKSFIQAHPTEIADILILLYWGMEAPSLRGYIGKELLQINIFDF